MKKTIIGVMGPGEKARPEDITNAFKLGKLIAEKDWILLSGGRNAGVMDAVNKGAKSAGGLTIGILPSCDGSDVSDFVDISIITGMGSARNNINVLSSRVVVACGAMEAGTLSEIALALKAQKQVILLNDDAEGQQFIKRVCKEKVHIANTPEAAVGLIQKLTLT